MMAHKQFCRYIRCIPLRARFPSLAWSGEFLQRVTSAESGPVLANSELSSGPDRRLRRPRLWAERRRLFKQSARGIGESLLF